MHGKSFIVKCGVMILSKLLIALARVISLTDFSSLASSTSFLEAKFPNESTIMNTWSPRVISSKRFTISNFNCSTCSSGI